VSIQFFFLGGGNGKSKHFGAFGMVCLFWAGQKVIRPGFFLIGAGVIAISPLNPGINASFYLRPTVQM